MKGKKKKKISRTRPKQAKSKSSARSSKRKAARPGLKDETESVDMQAILTEVHGVADQKHLEAWEQIECPYCGEGFEIHIDSAEDGQTMYQDCHVCCKPICLYVQVEEEDVHVSVARA